MGFTKDQLAAVGPFLKQVRDRARIDREEWREAYQSWARGARGWEVVYGFSGADIHTALWWYQYRHALGSKEWRPTVIIRALIQASERDYVEPERMMVNDVALNSTAADKKKARLAFIRKHGVAAFHQGVNPILRCGGVEALFLAPATPETREYVMLLASITSRRDNNNGAPRPDRV